MLFLQTGIDKLDHKELTIAACPSCMCYNLFTRAISKILFLEMCLMFVVEVYVIFYLD